VKTGRIAVTPPNVVTHETSDADETDETAKILATEFGWVRVVPEVIDGTGGTVSSDPPDPSFEEARERRARSLVQPDDDLPTASFEEDVLSPEQLVDQLTAQGGDGRRGEQGGSGMRGHGVRGPASSGAAVISVPGAGDDGAVGLDAGQRTARIPADAMIVGVRQLGSAPVRRGDAGEEYTDDEEAAAAHSSYFGVPLEKVVIAAGSSYVFTTGETVRGLEVEFSLPLVDGREQPADIRIVEADTGRELRKPILPPADDAEHSSDTSFEIPAGWIQPGRFSVELHAPTVPGFVPESVSVRVVDGN
jgi:hypothetical protein